MAAKLVFICVVAVATALEGTVDGPVQKVVYEEPSAPAQYVFEYTVEDQHSGDIKAQKENRNGDSVQGYYSLVQPDGTKRVVEYTSSKEHGFNAVVRYEGQPTAVPAKVYAARPVQYAAAPAPLVYSSPAPVAKLGYAAPKFAPTPVVYAPNAAKIAVAAPAQVASYAPLTRLAYTSAAQPQVAYAPAPSHVAYAPAQAPAVAHLAYAPAPAAKVTYASAPVAYASAPVPAIQQAYITSPGHVTFSSPAVSYQH